MNTPRYLNRREASEYLLARHGLKRSSQYLAKLASIGSNGPAFHKANRDTLYSPADLDAWAAKLIVPAGEHASHRRVVTS
jgi:hypothetical protein